MDLWVRSQNREILRINPELEIYEYGNEKYLVMDTKGYTNYDKAKVLGEYKTKRKALEVLDEIQSLLQPKIIYHQEKPVETIQEGCYQLSQKVNMEFQELSTYVYEMPEE